MKKMIVIMTLAIFVVGSAVILLDAKVSSAKSMIIPDADNKTCPVTGQAITAKKASTVYQGSRVWFSSYAAVQEFKKNPAKYAGNISTAAVAPAASTKAKSRY